MKRIPYQQLEDRAFLTRRLIEVDEEQGIAVVKIGRETFYATLPPAADRVDAEKGGGR